MSKKLTETPDVEAATAKRKPRVSVLERRLQNPFGEPSAPIRLKQKGLIARWFNSAVKADQFWRATELGWEGVTPDMIEDIRQIGFHTISPDGHVARGERAQEVLMYMPAADYHQIQAAKTRKNLEDMKDFDKEKVAALNAFAKEAGGLAAEYMSNRVKPVGGVATKREFVEHDASESVFGGHDLKPGDMT